MSIYFWCWHMIGHIHFFTPDNLVYHKIELEQYFLNACVCNGITQSGWLSPFRLPWGRNSSYKWSLNFCLNWLRSNCNQESFSSIYGPMFLMIPSFANNTGCTKRATGREGGCFLPPELASQLALLWAYSE